MRAFAIFLVCLSAALPASTVQAGCGCDKPPPPPAPIRPAFASPGATITLFPNGIAAGTAYDVVFQTTPPTRLRAIALDARDFADATQHTQLQVKVPPMPAGPLSVIVEAAGTPLLTIPADEFTMLPAPMPLPEANQTTVWPCYRAAVSGDGTVLVPFDVSAIGQRTSFSGASQGYRLTFGANDIAVYNTQGVLMQLLGPAQQGIFQIGDDQDATEDVQAPATTTATPQRDLLTNRIDFDEPNGYDLSKYFEVHDGSHDTLRATDGEGEGVPPSNGVALTDIDPILGTTNNAGERPTFAALSEAPGGFRDPGATVRVSTDVRFPADGEPAIAFVGLLGFGGGMVGLRVRQVPNAGFLVALETSDGGVAWEHLAGPESLAKTSNWLRLKAVFSYTGREITYTATVTDQGPDGLGPESQRLVFTGAFMSDALAGNPIVLRGFGGRRFYTSDRQSVQFDRFVDQYTPGTVPESEPGEKKLEGGGVDRTVRSFRLTYDRHEFQSYRTRHAVNDAFFLDASDPSWHQDGSRHFDHDHIVLAIRGLVNAATPPPAGTTPPFDLHITTTLVDDPPTASVPLVAVQGSCEETPPPAPGCTATPRTDCAAPPRAHGARLAIAGGSLPQRTFQWQWGKGSSVDAASFGDPLAGDPVSLCVYGTSDGDTLVGAALSASDATCGSARGRSRACWRSLGDDRGFTYRDNAGKRGGLQSIQMLANAPGRAPITAGASGSVITVPSLPLTAPVRVQLQNAHGGCWEARFGPQRARTNTATQFRATAD